MISWLSPAIMDMSLHIAAKSTARIAAKIAHLRGIDLKNTHKIGLSCPVKILKASLLLPFNSALNAKRMFFKKIKKLPVRSHVQSDFWAFSLMDEKREKRWLVIHDF